MKFLCAGFYSNLPVFFAAALLAAASFTFSGCYTLKQGTTMLGYLNRAVPLEDLRKDGASEEDRFFADRVESIRRFAVQELGLAESKNYTRYVELDRNYLAAVVSASAKDSFTRHEWWFPVVGSVPYKGFFDAADARKEREKLEKKGLDVWIRGVDAFSTLGWFRDPLYSYMKNYSGRSLARVLIHELVHATVFIKNHTQFNEELAEFTGSEGARLYMEKLRYAGGAETGAGAEGNEAAEADGAAYREFIGGLIAELDAVYESGISREEKLSRKEEIIEKAKADFAENYDSLFVTENYRGFSELPVNNAYLELYRLYHGENRYFEELYERSGRDLPKLIAAAKSLAGTKQKTDSGLKKELERALGL